MNLAEKQAAMRRQNRIKDRQNVRTPNRKAIWLAGIRAELPLRRVGRRIDTFAAENKSLREEISDMRSEIYARGGPGILTHPLGRGPQKEKHDV